MSVMQVEIAAGVTGAHIPSSRFKTTRISVNFILPLRPGTVSENAILPFVLTRSCALYPDYTALNRKLASLYGATLFADAIKLGDAQVLRVVAAALDDRFAENGGSIASECASLLLELIFDPALENGAFRQADIESEKRLFLERIRGEINNKRTYALARCEEIMCGGTPFGTPKYGTLEQTGALTPDSVCKALQRALRSARVHINVVGGGDPARVFDGFKKRFSGLSREPVFPGNEPAAQSGARSVTEKMEVTQGKLVMGFSTGVPEQDKTAPELRVMADLFGGGPYSKLFLNVRERLSLCYYCAARYNRRKGILFVDSGVEFQNTDKAREEILRQLELIRRGEFTEEELSASKKSLIDSVGTVADSPAGLDSWYTERLFDERPDSPGEYAAKLGAVTAGQVTDAARKASLHTTYILTGEG